MNKLLKSIQYVTNNSKFVTIDNEAIERYVATFELTKTDHWMRACPFAYHQLASIEDEIDRRFLQDAMAFCFWGYPDKWTVEYQDKSIDGWWALLAVIQSTLENNRSILDGNFLYNLSLEQAQEIFSGKPEIPLFKERVKIMHEIGRILVERFKGRFHHYLETAPVDAIALTQNIAKTFPTFDDVSIYKGEKVYFYKKAQLFVDELADEMGITITGKEKLPGKADYKIPALLRKLGILKYASELAKKIDSRIIIEADSPEEIEIRANMLWGNHLICQSLNQKGITIYPMQLDGILWVQSQTKDPEDKPYHLTLTTDY